MPRSLYFSIFAAVMFLSWTPLHAQTETSRKYQEVRGQIPEHDIDTAGPNGNSRFAFLDSFADNQNKWCTVDDTTKELSIVDGKFRIKGLNTWSHHVSKSFNIDVHQPFSCSVRVKWVEGDTSHGFGLNYCSDINSSSYYTFMIAANGYYTIQYYKNNGDWKKIIPWTKSGLIHKFSAENVLQVRADYTAIHFLINGVEVESLEFNGGYGKVFGCRANHKQTVDFDDFTINGQLRVPKASYKMDDTIHVIQPAEKHFLFTDNFDNNVNEWSEKNDSDIVSTVADGKFTMKGMGKRSYPSSKNFDINANKPFTCSMKVKWIGGLSSYGFGMNYSSDFGARSYYNFEVNAEGQYSIVFTENDGGWFNIRPWTTHPAVHKLDTANILKVKRSEDSIRFFINDIQVASAIYTGAYGQAFGFRTNNRVSVEYDDFLLEGESAPRRIPAVPAAYHPRGRQVPLSFYDSFKDNRNEWPTGTYSGDDIQVSQGRLKIQVMNENSFNSIKTFPVRTDQPFSCSVTARWMDGKTNNGFGLNFCADRQVLSYYLFEINSEGKYAILFLEKGEKWYDLKSWTRSLDIHTGSALNVLKVSEKNDSLYFFINDKQQTSLPYVGAYGSDFGMRVSNMQTVAFHDFSLDGYMIPKLSDSCQLDISDSMFNPNDLGTLRIINQSHQPLSAHISIEGYEQNVSASHRTGTDQGEWTEVIQDVSWMLKTTDKKYKSEIDIHPDGVTEVKGKFFGKDGISSPSLIEYEKYRFVVTFYDYDGMKGEFHSKSFQIRKKIR